MDRVPTHEPARSSTTCIWRVALSPCRTAALLAPSRGQYRIQQAEEGLACRGRRAQRSGMPAPCSDSHCGERGLPLVSTWISARVSFVCSSPPSAQRRIRLTRTPLEKELRSNPDFRYCDLYCFGPRRSRSSTRSFPRPQIAKVDAGEQRLKRFHVKGAKRAGDGGVLRRDGVQRHRACRGQQYPGSFVLVLHPGAGAQGEREARHAVGDL
jgi:hypothetical protein